MKKIKILTFVFFAFLSADVLASDSYEDVFTSWWEKLIGTAGAPDECAPTSCENN